jgi:hypothetical protein
VAGTLDTRQMETKGVKYDFIATPWQTIGPGSWTFVSLPKSIENEIRDNFKSEEEGWGRLKATAKIGKTQWKTAIWFDTKMNTFLLPLKAEIKKRENIQINKNVSATLWI